MKTIWEFLENFYAGVYVADMNTYELIYMNAKAREWFQISDPEEYAGKKCYAVLQKFRMPCPFCTNTQLIDDQFYEWDYYNPVINKTFHLKDYIIQYEGRKYRIEIAIPDDAVLKAKNGNADDTEMNPDFFINKCLMATHSVSDPSVSIGLMLQYAWKEWRRKRNFKLSVKLNATLYKAFISISRLNFRIFIVSCAVKIINSLKAELVLWKGL